MKKLLLLSIFFYFVSTSHAKQSMFPKNDMWVGPNDKSNSGIIKESDFQKIINDFQNHFENKVLEKLNAQLEVSGDWVDGSVNAYAMFKNNIFKIRIMGGLARFKKMNPDSINFVLCHELGHALAGGPKKPRSNWSSNEGQSDYWGATKCFKILKEKEDNISYIESLEIPIVVKEKCDEVFNLEEEAALCKRTSMAGYTLAELIQFKNTISFDRPSLNSVTSTDHDYPKVQCRLDTFFAGALCDKSPHQDEICTRRDGYLLGVRPKCWYFPSDDD